MPVIIVNLQLNNKHHYFLNSKQQGQKPYFYYSTRSMMMEQTQDNQEQRSQQASRLCWGRSFTAAATGGEEGRASPNNKDISFREKVKSNKTKQRQRRHLRSASKKIFFKLASGISTVLPSKGREGIFASTNGRREEFDQVMLIFDELEDMLIDQLDEEDAWGVLR